MMHAIGPLQGGQTIVGRGEPGAAVLPVYDCNTAYSRTALATVNGELYFKGPVILPGNNQPLAYVAGKVETAALTRESGYPPMK